MDCTPIFMAREQHRLVLSGPQRTTDAVVLELDKLKKPQVQTQEEKLREIDQLHESQEWKTEGRLTTKCAECWMTWPCATHRIIHPECEENCVHRI